MTLTLVPKSVSFINNAEWYPFNPGADEEEYAEVSHQLEAQLTKRSEYGFSQSSDSQTKGRSRSIVLEVLDVKEWNLDLVIFLQNFLSEIEESYCLLVSDAPEDRILGGGFLLISSERVDHWFQDSIECKAFWAGEHFSDPEGIGKRWSPNGWVAP